MTNQNSNSANDHHENNSTRSSINDLFSGGASVWLKIIGAAIVVPVAVFIASRRGARNGGIDILGDFATAMTVFGGTAIVGAILGAALSMKDVVESRMKDGKPVGFVLKLFFVRGILSVFAWIPFFILAMIVVLNLLGL